MCSGRGDGPLRPPGFPIRKSPDLSLVADSPGLIAGSYVLLRLLVPRHPPCALINLATTDDARVHCAVLKIRAVPRLPGARAAEIRSGRATGPCGRSLRTQQRARPAPPPGTWRSMSRALTSTADRTNQPGQLPRPNNQCSTNELATPGQAPEMWLWTPPTRQRQVLLRKEVIQPHLPVRLPCYDFVPIAGPTFDGSLPCGLGHRLRVLPTFVT